MKHVAKRMTVGIQSEGRSLSIKRCCVEQTRGGDVDELFL